MGQGTVSVAAATAIVGYDLLKDTRYKRMIDRGRIIRGIKLTGSAAVEDTDIEIFVGTDFQGNFKNTKTTGGNADDIQPVEIIVPPGQEIFALVTDAPATNPIVLTMLWDEY